MTRRLIDECQLRALKLKVKKPNYIVIRGTSRDTSRRWEGVISHVNEYTYSGVRITKDGNHEPEINDRINRGRAAITQLNSILWERDVTPKTTTHAIVKSTITCAAEVYYLLHKRIQFIFPCENFS
jgi:hypothetical protein